MAPSTPTPTATSTATPTARTPALCRIQTQPTTPTRAQCYKTFHGRNLLVFLRSYSDGHWQAFPA